MQATLFNFIRENGGSKESDKSCLKIYYLREGSVYFLYYYFPLWISMTSTVFNSTLKKHISSRK